jgi:hypothetical protein
MLNRIGGYPAAIQTSTQDEPWVQTINDSERPLPTSVLHADLASLALSLGGDPQAYLAAMLLKSGTDRRAQAAHERDLTEQAIQQLEERQVELMHDKADEIREAAWQGLACDLMASGSKLAGVASEEQGAGDAGAQLFNAFGTFTRAQSNARVTELDSAVTEAQHQAEAAKRSLEDVRTDREAAEELTDQAFAFLRETHAIQAETEQAITFRA